MLTGVAVSQVSVVDGAMATAPLSVSLLSLAMALTFMNARPMAHFDDICLVVVTL